MSPTDSEDRVNRDTIARDLLSDATRQRQEKAGEISKWAMAQVIGGATAMALSGTWFLGCLCLGVLSFSAPIGVLVGGVILTLGLIHYRSVASDRPGPAEDRHRL